MSNYRSPYLYGNYRNRSFTDIWPSAEAFLEDYNNAGIPATIAETSATTLYYLLYARYGNSTIASYDETQFKYKVFTLIFMYGPTWEKRIEIQKEIRGTELEEFLKGSAAIYNHAQNPSTAPSTQTTEELPYIDSQNVQKYRRSRAEAYTNLMALLETDVTAYFLDRFKNLFLVIVEPEAPLWFVTKLNDDVIIDDENDEEE